jgi:hypothetical protein
MTESIDFALRAVFLIACTFCGCVALSIALGWLSDAIAEAFDVEDWL